MNRKTKRWLVKWKLMGCPHELPDDMLATIPQEALQQKEAGLPISNFQIKYFRDRDGRIRIEKWPGTFMYTFEFTDDTDELHKEHYKNWQEIKSALARILGHG